MLPNKIEVLGKKAYSAKRDLLYRQYNTACPIYFPVDPEYEEKLINMFGRSNHIVGRIFVWRRGESSMVLYSMRRVKVVVERIPGKDYAICLMPKEVPARFKYAVANALLGSYHETGELIKDVRGVHIMRLMNKWKEFTELDWPVRRPEFKTWLKFDRAKVAKMQKSILGGSAP